MAAIDQVLPGLTITDFTGIGMIDHPPAWYVTNGFEYLVFGEYMYGRFYSEPDRYASEVSQYEALFDTFDTVKIFADGGYEVRICCVVCEEANR